MPPRAAAVADRLGLGRLALARTPALARHVVVEEPREERVGLPLGAREVERVVAAVVVAIVVAIVLRFVLTRMRIGIAMRASVDDPSLAALNGARPNMVSSVAWSLGCSMAAISGILIAPEAAMATSAEFPRYPSLFQINTRVRLSELSAALGRPATLDEYVGQLEAKRALTTLLQAARERGICIAQPVEPGVEPVARPRDHPPPARHRQIVRCAGAAMAPCMC